MVIFKGLREKKEREEMEVEISQFSSRNLFKQQAEHCAFFFFFLFLTASRWTLYLLFSTSPFSRARSLRPVIPRAPSALLHV